MFSGVTIEATDLIVRYGDLTALNISSLTASGRIISLIGHNGSGKSTFLKTLLQLLQPKTGTLKGVADGRQLIPELDMLFSPENGAVFADIPVQSYLRLWCRLKRRDPELYRKEGAQYIEQLELEGLLHKLGRDLSKGQRRRVQIAVGLLVAPSLLVLDEPFEGLDIRQAARLAEIMRVGLPETSLIISSHRMDIVEQLSATIILLEQGNVVSSGKRETVSQEIAGPLHAASLPEGVDLAPVAAYLSARFPHALVRWTNQEVTLLGADIDRTSIEIAFQALRQDCVRLEERVPSLTEAVHYRLRKGALPNHASIRLNPLE